MQQQIESIILSSVGNRLTQELAHGIILGVLQVAQQATNDATAAVRAPSRRCRTSRCWTSRVPLARRRPPAAVRWIMWTRLPSAGRERAAACGEDAAAAQGHCNEEGAPMSAPFDQAVALRWMRGNASAVDFLRSAFDVAHFWDDLADKDQILDDARSMPPCSRRWSCCRAAFYRLHFDG